MSYVTSPFIVMAVLLVLCIMASVGLTTLLNKVYDFPLKSDIIIGTGFTILSFVAAIWIIF